MEDFEEKILVKKLLNVVSFANEIFGVSNIVEEKRMVVTSNCLLLCIFIYSLLIIPRS